MKLSFKTELKKPMSDVFASFNRKFFEFLTPPFVQLEILRFDGVDVHNKFSLKINSYLGTQMWEGEITERVIGNEECYFIDKGLKLPFPLTHWSHKHRVLKQGESNSIMIDELDFEVKPGLQNFTKLIMISFFLFRKIKYRQYFS